MAHCSRDKRKSNPIITDVVVTSDVLASRMVMNNGEAVKRHGFKQTYKKIKRFQPFQMT